MCIDEDCDNIVDEVGDVEMPTMGETGHKFNEIVLSDDDYDNVVIENNKQDTEIARKATFFTHKVSKFSSSYDYQNNIAEYKQFIANTVNDRLKIPTKDTIDDDDIKEEINVVEDDSEDEQPNSKFRQRFLDRIAGNNKTMGARQSKTSSKIK
jgi:hypothetical protein